MREGKINRKTNETDIALEINLDKAGENNIKTGIGFLDHMLNLFAFRAGITLNISCNGDLEVDGHHTVEDIGIALGKCINDALGEKKGINRYGNGRVPMDECLATVDLDISGRPYLVFNAELSTAKVGDFETELAEEFFRAFAMNSLITLHINLVYGKNTHHQLEAIFKALGLAFKEAIKVTGEAIPSTKGVL